MDFSHHNWHKSPNPARVASDDGGIRLFGDEWWEIFLAYFCPDLPPWPCREQLWDKSISHGFHDLQLCTLHALYLDSGDSWWEKSILHGKPYKMYIISHENHVRLIYIAIVLNMSWGTFGSMREDMHILACMAFFRVRDGFILAQVTLSMWRVLR